MSKKVENQNVAEILIDELPVEKKNPSKNALHWTKVFHFIITTQKNTQNVNKSRDKCIKVLLSHVIGVNNTNKKHFFSKKLKVKVINCHPKSGKKLSLPYSNIHEKSQKLGNFYLIPQPFKQLIGFLVYCSDWWQCKLCVLCM